jgi:hypothetical protein
MVCVVDVANVEPRVQKIGGEREVKKKQQSIVKGGGCVIALWGVRRGEVVLSSSLSSRPSRMTM